MHELGENIYLEMEGHRGQYTSACNLQGVFRMIVMHPPRMPDSEKNVALTIFFFLFSIDQRRILEPKILVMFMTTYG
jgi:hypothetical protein